MSCSTSVLSRLSCPDRQPEICLPHQPGPHCSHPGRGCQDYTTVRRVAETRASSSLSFPCHSSSLELGTQAPGKPFYSEWVVEAQLLAH